MSEKLVIWFEEADKHDTPLVGGKGANLGEMIRSGIPVPYGFIVTVNAYYQFLTLNNLKEKIKDYIKTINWEDPTSVDHVSQLIKKDILKSPIAGELGKEIIDYYFQLEKRAAKLYKKTGGLKSLLKEPLVAVRSSATAEDLPKASFAGQQATFLNVQGEANLVEKVREAWASLFEPRAIFYRHEQKLDHTLIGIAVPVQLMVSASSSGVMFTLDPLSNDKTKIIIESIYGLGELIVQGTVTPDHYEVDKKSLNILNKKLADQEKMLIKKGARNTEVSVPVRQRSKQKISDREIVQLAKLGKKIENHYFFPQDIEWAIEDSIVYIVQSRPITTIKSEQSTIHNQQSIRKSDQLEVESRKLKVLLRGDPASPGIATGPVKIIHSAKQIGKIAKGDILVTEQTNPDFVPAMKKAAAIVTQKGGRTSHAAIVSRELGVPAIVGATDALKILKNGLTITVNGKTGEVFKGGLTLEHKNLSFIPDNTILPQNPLKTATKIYINLAEPQKAKADAQLNVDGVGLLRAEFMIADIGVHPKKLIHEKRQKVFIHKLASDLLTFCQSFSPRPVVYRATDFKTNEYRNLKGGKDYEPDESNPMLGFRGAYRYIANPDVFELELEAIKLVRNKFGYKNLWLMIPFVRTVDELRQVKKIVGASGLLRSDNFKIWMMVEIPSNVILLEKFCEVGIDGISIGSNDLTMLILGTDRDNSEVAPVFDERNPAVLWALEKVISTCHKYKITSSICGQAPSDYPDLVEKLVSWGVTSISINPDAVDRTRESVYNFEKRLVSKRSKT